jgi:hypothetical protein
VRSQTMKWTYLIIVFMLSACATPKKQESPVQVPSVPGQERVNVDEVTRNLGMDRPRESLGYDERRFNTCEAGGGYPSTENCRERYLAVVNLRLQCRDTDGTTSKINHQLRPVRSDRVKWDWAGQSAYTRSDGEGYSQVKMISRKSPRKDRLRITVGSKFLAMTAEEMNRIVAPNEWCK